MLWRTFCFIATAFFLLLFECPAAEGSSDEPREKEINSSTEETAEHGVYFAVGESYAFCLQFATLVYVKDARTIVKRGKTMEQTCYSPVIEPDHSSPFVNVTLENRTIRKKLSPDGWLMFSIADFDSGTIDRANVLTFKIHHPVWNKTWIMESPAFLSPTSIRDWNLFADKKYDCRTRMNALFRLKPFMGDDSFQILFKQFLNNKVDREQITAPEIKILVE